MMSTCIDDDNRCDPVENTFYIACNTQACPGIITLEVSVVTLDIMNVTFKPPRGKTNNVVSDQVMHKPACTATEAG